MAWRLAAGLTQAELANSVRKLAADAGKPCSPSTPSCQQISRWENGHDRPGAFYQGLLAAWYRTDPARLGLIGDVWPAGQDDHLPGTDHLPDTPDTDEAEDNVDRRRFLAVAAAPVLFQLDQIRRRMDVDLRHVLPARDVDHWAQIADHYVSAYGTEPPGKLLERLAPDLHDLADIVGQYPHQRDLTQLAARLCGLTGALHTDLGDNRAARDWLHTAGHYAARSGDAAIEYWVAMAQAMTATYSSSPERVLAIAGKAASKLGPRPVAAAAQLTGLAARAHAAIGDHGMARAQLAAAERTASSLTPAQADETFFGFPRREMLMYVSQVLSVLDDPAAWNAQAEALSCYPDTDCVDRPLIQLDRASYLARRGEADRAAHTALAAVVGLAPEWRVPLLVSAARTAGKAITTASAKAGRQYAASLREAVPG